MRYIVDTDGVTVTLVESLIAKLKENRALSDSWVADEKNLHHFITFFRVLLTMAFRRILCSFVS